MRRLRLAHFLICKTNFGVYMGKKYWYPDYYRTTDDKKFILRHFIRDFIFQQRLRYIIYFRVAQNTKSKIIKIFCDYKLLRLSRKFGIEIKSETKIGKGFLMIHAYNITISPYAVIGENCTMLKGSTIGLVHKGKKKGAPTIGDKVYVGLNSTILGGIKVGDDVLIAPNTFVDVDVPSHSIVIGSPCKIISKNDATKNVLNKTWEE